jgi:hypothetical protein
MSAFSCIARRRTGSEEFVPDSRFVHLGAGSGGRASTRLNRHFFESLDAYVRKHHGIIGLISLRAAMVVGCLTRAVGWTVSALLPKRRHLALGKARHHARLVVRQVFHWPVGR